MAYPKGTRFNRWLLNTENQRGIQRFTIKRWVYFPDGTKKLERLSLKKYRSIRGDEAELQEYIVRLNQETSRKELTKNAVEIRHAFISPKLLDDYKDYLLVQIPTKGKALNEFHYLKTYFLGFFINKLNLPNPLQWHAVHKTEWAIYLVSDEAPSSGAAKKDIVAAANRFIAWLHDRRPSEVPPLRFQPLTKAKYKEIEATRQLKGEARKPKFIKDEHWAKIRLRSTAELTPFILLAYHYGLRRSETLGLTTDDVRTGYLSIERQLASYSDHTPLYAPPKGRETRKVPHWLGSPKNAYRWATDASSNLAHPDTLTDLWSDLMKKLDLDYTFHDLRHTWITKTIRTNNPRDVQLAAGHKNIETTMRYAHDDRELEGQKFIPEAS